MRASIVAALVSLPSTSLASPGAEHILRSMGPDAVIAKTTWPIVVATVVSVSKGSATHGSPPTGVISVEEVLRGDLQLGRLQARWAPFPHDVDWAGEGAAEALASWKALPMERPKTEKMILIGQLEDGVFRISSLGQFPFSEQLKERTLNLISSGAVQLAAFKAVNEEVRRHQSLGYAKQLADWRAAMTPGALQKIVESSGFIGIGTLASWSGGPRGPQLTIDIDTVLKHGEASSPTQVMVAVPPGLNMALSEQRYRARTLRLMVFIKPLQERRLPGWLGDELVDPMLGLMIHDDALEAQARALTL